MAIQQTPELERLIEKAFDRDASDLLLISDEAPSFRIKGEIERDSGEILSSEQIGAIALAALGEEKLKKLGTEVGELTTSCSIPGVVDGRMCIAKTLGDYSIIVRLMPSKIPDVERIRLPKAMLEVSQLTHGLVIFAGLTGSGKTTTMLSFLDYINSTRACHICTVEDPAVYRLVPKKAIVQQREVGIDIPSSLSGISTAMRQNADVLMIGELNFIEEIQTGITAAQFGTLVLTQVHANSPGAAIQRLLDAQMEENIATYRKYLAEVLRAVLVQTLVPRKNGGRVAVYGLVLVDDEMREAIINGEDILQRKGSFSEGCRTIEEDMEKLRLEGII